MLVQLIGVDQMARRAPATVQAAVELAHQLVDELAATQGGARRRASFDGMLLCFPDVRSAVAMSLELQQRLLAVDWPEGLSLQGEAADDLDAEGRALFRGLRARIAVHMGWVAEEFGRLFGPGAYQLGRIASVGSGGQTLVSDPAWRNLTGRLPGGTVVRDLGTHRLPGVHGRSRLFQVLPAILDARRLPPLATSDRSNVPPATAAILGRDGDLLAIAELYSLGVRVITVVGPEGVGRRRFVEQLARRPPAHTAAHGGARLVRPHDDSPLELVRATGAALGVPSATAGTLERAVEQIGHALAALGPLLLVFSGSVTAVKVLERWLDLAPDVRLLLQGTAPTGVRTEVPYRLRHLPTPTAHAGLHDDAVRIYTSAAQRVSPDFQLHDALDATIIAQALGGGPHALQLAGAIADRLPADKLAARVLGRSLDLRALIDTVLDHLTERECEILQACAAIPSAFEDELPAWMLENPDDLQDVLESLRQRGLIVPSPSADRPHSCRWAVEHNVRAAVRERARPEELRRSERRAAEGMVAGAEMWLPFTLGVHRAEVLARLAMDAAGLLAVARPAGDEESGLDVDLAARAVVALQPVLRSRGPLALERALQDQVLARCDRQLDSDPIFQSRLLLARANGTIRAGRQAVWEVDLARARSLVERWDDADGQARLALVEGRAARAMGQPDAAIRHLASARYAFLALDDAIRASVADVEIGMVCVEAGRFARGEEALQQAQRRLADGSCPHVQARALATLATLYRRTHRPASARSAGREALRIFETTGSLVAAARLRRELALLDYQLARYGEATAGLRAAVSSARLLGNRRLEGEHLYVLALVALAEQDHAEARRVLLEALALARDQQDRLREGEVMGLLGVVHHLDEHADAARDFYAQATRILANRDGGRRQALFLAWWGELEAEQTHVEEARRRFEQAEATLAHTQDPEVTEALALLRTPIALAEAVLEDRAESGRQALRRALRGTDPRSLSGQGRLAFRRARRLASRGLPGQEPAAHASLPPRPELPTADAPALQVSNAPWELPQAGEEELNASVLPAPRRREAPEPPDAGGELELPE